MTTDSKAGSAPWEAVAPHEQLFVLITGTNGGVGLAIAQRIIDEFLATRSLIAHLVLLPTTRSSEKSLEVVDALRRYAENAAKRSPLLASRSGKAPYKCQDTVARIHILSLPLDLCDLRAVYSTAEALCHGTVGNPPGLEGEYLQDVRIPRLDSIICNAAYGGWSGCSYLMAFWTMFTTGIVEAVTWPTYKYSLPDCTLNKRNDYKYPSTPTLGEVFCACVFGHYNLAHQLLPLLSRKSTDRGVAPGRIIWSSSVEAIDGVYDPTDMQGLRGLKAYESSKRLTDILSLTCSLPSVRPFSAQYLSMDEDEENRIPAGNNNNNNNNTLEEPLIPPKMYLSHPGILRSSLFPLPWWLIWAYNLVLVIARWIGSPWHNVEAYPAAHSASWIALSDQEALDASHAEKIKWGSAINRSLEEFVKKTEVDGWGWEGTPETQETIKRDGESGILHKSRGRRAGAKPVTTEEDIAGFVELGAKAWAEMESLRCQWDNILRSEKLE